MLARLHVFLPFAIAVPEGEQYLIRSYDDQGYRVQIFPPARSDQVLATDNPNEIKIDDKQAFLANALHVEFLRDSFNRATGSPCDPPEQIMEQAVNSFLLRLRHVTRALQIRSLSFRRTAWRLQYLADDGAELEAKEGFVRERGALQQSFRWVALNSQAWEQLHTLPPQYDPPPWEALLLDANAQLPDIGPAIVLAATALEVLAAHVLNDLARIKYVSPELWQWINKRGDWLREPTVEEQYDALLNLLSGHSLKEEQTLWVAFKSLKTARNSFVHEGVAKFGGAPLSEESAYKLIASAWNVVTQVRDWLPEALRWPEFKPTISVEVVKRFI